MLAKCSGAHLSDALLEALAEPRLCCPGEAGASIGEPGRWRVA